MYRGKATCKILKEIRKQIAKENDIAFVTSECKYQGDCLGTCPACEAEVRYLEEELRKRKQLGKTAVVTGVSLGLATTFLGCHFGGNVENPAVPIPSSKQAKQENIISSSPDSENTSIEEQTEKSERSSQKSSVTCGLDFDVDFGGIEDKPDSTQPLSSDTIDITYEMPEFELDGTISATRITLPKEFGDVCLYPAVAPIYQGDGEDYKKFIQQHFKISPKIKKDLLYTPIIFKFTIEKNGKVGQIFTSSNILDPSLQKRWNKRCERAARRAIKAMPRWIPGKDVNRSPVRCCKDGIIIINNPIEVNDY